jgi:hypothetical protein
MFALFAPDLFKGICYGLTMLLREKIEKLSTMHGKLNTAF